MEISNNPREWLDYHWIQEDLPFYFKQVNSKRKQHLPTLQSIKSNLKGLSKNTSECYLCGLEMTKQTNDYGGILTDSNLCMVSGFPYDPYEQSLINIFKIFKTNDVSEKYKQVYKDYKEFQRKIWTNNYYSVHKECLYHRHLKEFISIDFINQQIKPVDTLDKNIKKLLSSIFILNDKNKNHTKTKTKTKTKNKYKRPKLKLSKDALDRHIISQYKTIKFNVQRLYSILVEYGTKIFKYSVISIITSLTMFLDIFEIIPFSLFTLLETMNIEIDVKTKYYDKGNLSNETIQNMCIDLCSFTHNELPKFCLFFRSYLNLLYTINEIINETIDENTHSRYRKNVINVSNYIWNVWSTKYNIEESLISGDRESISIINTGDKFDMWAKHYKKGIYYQEIIEIIGKKMSNKKIKKRDTESISIREEEEEEEEEKKDINKPNKNIIDDLKNMRFTIDNKELVF